MRFAGLCGLAIAALATPSLAADLPVLRGSQDPVLGDATYFRWDGFYVGGHGSYTAGSADLSEANSNIVSYLLRNTLIEQEMQVSSWTSLPNRNGATGTGWGGFIGYNWQFDDAVVGLEGNYTRTSLNMGATDSMGRRQTIDVTNQTPNPLIHDVTLTNSAAVKVTDLGTLRVRGGWAASWFMPYGFVGVAIGRGDLTRSAAVTDNEYYTNGYPYRTVGPDSRSDNKAGTYAFGYTAGGGIDVCLMANLFLRAEYEYVYFGDFSGTKVSLNTVRGGIGLKF